MLLSCTITCCEYIGWEINFIHSYRYINAQLNPLYFSPQVWCMNARLHYPWMIPMSYHRQYLAWVTTKNNCYTTKRLVNLQNVSGRSINAIHLVNMANHYLIPNDKFHFPLQLSSVRLSLDVTERCLINWDRYFEPWMCSSSTFKDFSYNTWRGNS